jgi:hypothetical protein
MIPGPTFSKDKSSLPCGCRVGRDEGRLRLWFCSTHAAAFEMLEVLRLNVAVLDDILDNTPTGQGDLSRAMDAGMRTRRVIRKATAGVWR